MTPTAVCNTEPRGTLLPNPGWLLLALALVQIGAVIALYVFIGLHHVGALHFAPVTPPTNLGSGYPY